MKRSSCSLLSAVAFVPLIFACSAPPAPGSMNDLRAPDPGADLASAPDLGMSQDLSPSPDLAGPPCLHGQTRKNGVCSCTVVDDIVCGEGHCCAPTQMCLPPTMSAMYRCTGPSKRQRAALAYDVSRNRSLLFGGEITVDTAIDSHFELDKDTWEPLRGTAAAGVPSARHGASLVYDEFNKRLLLFGGQSNATNYFNELYAYDGTWKRIMTPSAPSARALTAMAYDSARRVVVLYGGDEKVGSDTAYNGDTWEFNVQTDRWVLRAMSEAGTTPLKMEGHAMAYDAKNRRTILFGGSFGLYRYSNETWAWNGTQWTRIMTVAANTPNPRAYFGMAYDSKREVVALGNGETNAGLFQALGDIWELDGSAWTRKSATPAPVGRLGSVWTYDAGRGMVLLFGGLQNDIMDASNELWGWNGTAWTRL